MKKVLVIAFTAAAALAITGCSSVQTTNKLNGLSIASQPKTQTVAHVNANISGLYLFSVIPLISGSANSPGKAALFSDTVTLENCMLMMTKQIRMMPATRISDVQSKIENTWNWYSFFFWTRNVQISANALRSNSAAVGPVAAPMPQPVPMAQPAPMPELVK
ncbi:MAG: hypothetical protein WC071_10130 [Victivallaceae bacterium]